MRATSLLWHAANLFSTWAAASVASATPGKSLQPPAVWENDMLVHSVNLERSYSREMVNIVISNISPVQQDKYYISFPHHLSDKIGSLEAKDRADPSVRFPVSKGPEPADLSEYHYYEVSLPPVEPGGKITASISYSVFNATLPLPAKIEQTETQHLSYRLSSHFLSPYKTLHQKTKIRFPTASAPEYTKLERPATDDHEAGHDPTQQGSTFTYGPYINIPPYSQLFISMRYKFPNPVIYASKLERDVEVSHWGGNLAIEERYWIENLGAQLREPFSRLKFQISEIQGSISTPAIRRLVFPLAGGAADPYFVDTIGNVSTSRFRSSPKEALLDLKPRYPIFGGWKYSFKVGWNLDLTRFLKRRGGDDAYVLRVALIEGPKDPSGVQYGKVQIRVILPEGAKNVKFETSSPIALSSEITFHKTFLDTLGRTCLILKAENLDDEWRNTDLLVSYEYPWTALLRKPVVVSVGLMVPFVLAWVVSWVDIDIRVKGGKAEKGKKRE